jgi:hypothetical protein
MLQPEQLPCNQSAQTSVRKDDYEEDNCDPVIADPRQPAITGWLHRL